MSEAGSRPTRVDLRKVKTIISLMGGQRNISEISLLPVTNYKCIENLHVYVSRNEPNEFHLSIWDQPKKQSSSRCLFADRMRTQTFLQSLAFGAPYIRRKEEKQDPLNLPSPCKGRKKSHIRAWAAGRPAPPSCFSLPSTPSHHKGFMKLVSGYC